MYHHMVWDLRNLVLVPNRNIVVLTFIASEKGLVVNCQAIPWQKASSFSFKESFNSNSSKYFLTVIVVLIGYPNFRVASAAPAHYAWTPPARLTPCLTHPGQGPRHVPNQPCLHLADRHHERQGQHQQLLYDVGKYPDAR